MRIIYFSPYDILRARTNQISDMRLCEGFAENGCHVELIAPYVHRKDNLERGQVFAAYGITTPFRTTIMKTFFRDKTPKILFIPILLLYCLFSTVRVFLGNSGRLSETVIMSRSVDLLIPSLVLKKLLRLRQGPKIICWAHEVIFRKKYLWVYRNADGVVGTNSAITADLSEKIGVPRVKTAVSLNPVAENQVRNTITREEARNMLGLSVNKPLVVYTGKLYVNQREAECILEAASLLPGFHFLLTGGKDHVVDHYRRWCAERGISNVTFTGFLRDYTRVGYYQAAADILISYYTDQDHLVRYNLPQKIGEYMLTRNPIVTCNYPATADVLNEMNALFVEPENATALAEGIQRAADNTEISARVAAQAFADAREMTFRNRTGILMEFFGTLPS